jgi:small nuclear ribonucleoprotein (snRNP)-like protein
MDSFCRTLNRCVALLLMCALFASSQAYAAPRPLGPEEVHKRLLKRGVGNWVYIEEKNGIALVGRIVSIDDEFFGLQLQNYPEATAVSYADVSRIRTGMSKKGVILLAAAMTGGAILAGVLMHNAFENNKAKMPNPVTRPQLP